MIFYCIALHFQLVKASRIQMGSVRPDDVAMIVLFVSYFTTAVILIAIMTRLTWEARKYFNKASNDEIHLTNQHMVDTNRRNTNLAFAISIVSTAMCVSYGLYTVIDYTKHKNKSYYNSLSSIADYAFGPNVISVTLRTIAILLFLSQSLYKLDNEYKEKGKTAVGFYRRLFLTVLIAICGALSFLGVILDHIHSIEEKHGVYYYYLTNTTAFAVATLVIGIIGCLFYGRLATYNSEGIIEKVMSVNRQSFDAKTPTERVLDELDHLIKPTLLSGYQAVFMTCDFIFEVIIYIWYYKMRNNHHYFAHPLQTISFCILVIIVNFCVWVSMDYADSWYLKKVFCGLCHDWLKDKFFNDPRLRMNTRYLINGNNNVNNNVNNNYNNLDDEPSGVAINLHGS